MSAVRALLFDLDGTLIDGRGRAAAVRQTCNDLAAWAGLDADRVVEANREAYREYWAEVEPAWDIGRLSNEAVGIEAWRRTLARCGRDAPELAARADALLSRRRGEVIRLFDDAKSLLAALPRDLPLAIVTNGSSETQRQSIEVTGIGPRFAAIFVSAEHGVAKPDPRAFASVLAQLGVAPGDAWHVGDRAETDVAGARAADVKAAWLNRNRESRPPGAPQPDAELHSLTEVLALIRA